MPIKGKRHKEGAKFSRSLYASSIVKGSSPSEILATPMAEGGKARNGKCIHSDRITQENDTVK